MSIMPGEAEPERAEIEPYDTIGQFLDANQIFIQQAAAVIARPSIEQIERTYSQKSAAIMSMAPIFDNEFFRLSGELELIDTATSAVMETTKNLWSTAHTLRPDDPTEVSFADDVYPHVMQILSDEEPNPSEIDRATKILFGAHEGAVNNLFDKVMSSDSVVAYSLDVGERAERQKRLIGYGATALAAFIGAGLAHYTFSRKKR